MVISTISANPCLQTTFTYCSTLPQFSGTENLIKKSVSQTLSNVKKAKVKPLTVSQPETFIKTETSFFHDESLIIRGESLQTLIKVKTTETLGYNFVSLWEIETVNSFGNCTENEKGPFQGHNHLLHQFSPTGDGATFCYGAQSNDGY